MRRTGRMAAAVLALGALVAASCGDDDDTGAASNGVDGEGDSAENGDRETLRLGYVGTLSGPASFLGEAPRQGAELAIDEINSQGGVCGFDFSMTSEDDELDPAVGVSVAQKLVSQDKVSAIIGSAHSGVSLAMVAVTESAEVPQISPLSALNDLTDPVKPYFFRLWNNDRTISRTLAEFAAESYDRIGLVYETTAFGQGGRDALTGAFEDVDAELVAAEAFDLAAQDLTPQLVTLRNANAEAVIVQSQGPQAALTARNLQQLGYDVPIIGHPGLAQQGFVALAEGAAEGSMVIDGLDREKPEAEAFIDLYEAEHGEAPFSFYPATGYDAVHLIAAGLENADCDPGAIQSGLEQVQGFTGAVGRPEAEITFAADDHDGYGAEALIFKEISDGELAPLNESE